MFGLEEPGDFTGAGGNVTVLGGKRPGVRAEPRAGDGDKQPFSPAAMWQQFPTKALLHLCLVLFCLNRLFLDVCLSLSTPLPLPWFYCYK